MKKTVVQKTVAQLKDHQLSKNDLAKIIGGSNDKTEDIVIIDVITP